MGDTPVHPGAHDDSCPCHAWRRHAHAVAAFDCGWDAAAFRRAWAQAWAETQEDAEILAQHPAPRVRMPRTRSRNQVVRDHLIERLLVEVERNGNQSIEDFSVAIGSSAATAGNLMRQLIYTGQVRSVGAARYQLVKEESPTVVPFRQKAAG